MKLGTEAAEASTRSLCIVLPYEPSPTETFIRSHIERLPANVTVVHGWRPAIGGKTVLSFPRRVCYKLLRLATRTDIERERTAAYLEVLRKYRIDAVLAEYGDKAVDVVQACRRSGVPLIAHFHGYDASVQSVLTQHRTTYPAMFAEAAAIIAVSRAMRERLIELGAPAEKVHLNYYGVDCTRFHGAHPAAAPPVFLGVGRLTPKKAPDLTLKAFSIVNRQLPSTTLRIIGDGPMMEECRMLANDLGIADAVTLLGKQSPAVIQEEMRKARCFVQHSITAPSGDSEGTPVSILEASATGLPIVSTRHAGIPDVVEHGETGFLVDERDVNGMAEHMLRLATNADDAGRMGNAAQRRAREQFSIERSIDNLWRIIESAIAEWQIATP